MMTRSPISAENTVAVAPIELSRPMQTLRADDRVGADDRARADPRARPDDGAGIDGDPRFETRLRMNMGAFGNPVLAVTRARPRRLGKKPRHEHRHGAIAAAA